MIWTYTDYLDKTVLDDLKWPLKWYEYVV